MIDPSTEPPFNDRRPGEPDAAWGDRPGIVASLLRYRMIVVAATLLGAVAGYGLAQQLPVRYQADATLILADPGGPSILGGGNSLSTSDRQVYLAKQADIMSSRVVLERALQILGSDQSISDIRDELEVHPAANMASISIAAKTADPGAAAALANAVGTAYEQVTQERVAADGQRAIASLEELRKRAQVNLDASPKSPDGELTFRQQQLTAQIAGLQQREQDITTQVGVYASGVEYFEQAEPPTSPSQPKPKLAGALGGLLGLLTAAVWAWWAAGRDQRAEGRAEPARILEAPLLGEVPPLRAPQMASGEAMTPAGLDPAVDDAFHLIVASLEHELAGVGGKSIAVTSVQPGDSKTSTALQIANAASQENRNVLLIDADVRLRHLSERVGSVQTAGKAQRPEAAHAAWRAGPRQGVPRPARVDRQRHGPTARLEISRPPASGGVRWRGGRARSGALHRGRLRPRPDRCASAPGVLERPRCCPTGRRCRAGRPHRVTLNDLREVRDRLAFVKTPLLGYVYVRPRGLGLRRKPSSRRNERS